MTKRVQDQFESELAQAIQENAQSADPLSPDAIEEKVKLELQSELDQVPAHIDMISAKVVPFPWSFNGSMFMLLGLAMMQMSEEKVDQ